MLPRISASKSFVVWGFLFFLSSPVWGQGSYVTPVNSEFQVVKPKFGTQLPGDQVNPSISLSASGNFIAWEDNVVDGNGSGIGMGRLGVDFTTNGVVRVNKSATYDQLKPMVQRLQNGQTVFVWQSSAAGSPDVYARFYKNGAFYTSDIRVNSYTRDQQISPVVTALPDGGAIVAWSSYNQDGDMWGVFARKVTASGTAPKKEFQVNQISAYNQRNPALATLANGNFVVVWSSEQERRFGSLDIYGRIFRADGTPVTDEIEINSSTNYCADPVVAATVDGGFVVAWSEKDRANVTNSWDIVGRSFGGTGASNGDQVKINTFLAGDQYCPKIASCSAGCLVVWTSLGQDGSREGIFGRFWDSNLGPSGDEFMVNTTRVSQQIHPAVAWNGTDRFLVVWSGMAAGGFDLFGQVYQLNSAK